MSAAPRNKEILRRYTSLSAVIQLLRNKELMLLSPTKWDDRNDAYFLSQYARQKGLGSVLAACFATAGETYHHWKVFSHGLDGVCVEFDGEKLRGQLKGHKGLSFGQVRYLKLGEIRKKPPKMRELPFVKRYPFRDEKEFRIVYDSAEQAEFKAFPIDIGAISRVVLSPWSNKDLSDAIKATLHDIDGCGRLKVYRTTLIDNEGWKQAIS